MMLKPAIDGTYDHISLIHYLLTHRFTPKLGFNAFSESSSAWFSWLFIAFKAIIEIAFAAI